MPLEITSTSGVPMVVTHKPDNEHGAVISFFDTRYPRDGQPGQFASSYYYSTLAGTDADGFGLRPRGKPLKLHGGIPAWDLDGETMDRVMDWLLQEIGRAPAKLRAVDDLPF